MRFRGLVLALVALTQIAHAAQSSRLAFEVASVKPNVSRGFPVGPETRPGGAFVANNVTLERLVRFAFDVPEYQLTGGPGWVRADRFDVDARAGRDATPEELRRMVQALLEDRFQLVLRREQREMPSYALVTARDDKRPGPNLRQSSPDCALDSRGQVMEERRTPNGGVAIRRTCSSIALLVASLSNALQAPVHDNTDLTGLWDYELSFAGERRRNVDPSVAARDPTDAPAPSTAVQEQLGLRLETGRAPVEVLIIESAGQPTSN